MKKTVFAVHKDQLYVESRAVMAPLIAMIDGVSMTFFGKSKKAYLKVPEAIIWLERELEHNPRYPEGTGKGTAMLDALKHATELFATGKTTENT